MHFKFWISFILILWCYGTHASEIPEPTTFEPKIVPSNVASARQALGYDKYEKQPVESSRQLGRKKYPYGNNWEDFDTDSQPPFNFGYNG